MDFDSVLTSLSTELFCDSLPREKKRRGRLAFACH